MSCHINRTPLQNRVDPWGQLQADPSKASTLMGNRGILHNDQKEIVRKWAGRAWLTCKLDFNGIHREVFGRGTYSELFFLDEATAFAAGHRPCAECRRQRFNEFKAAWLAADEDESKPPFQPIGLIDRQLHVERAARKGRKVGYQATLGELPSGTFIEMDDRVFVLWKGTLRAWAFTGYREARTLSEGAAVTVLTPPSVVNLFARGFVPEIHESIAVSPRNAGEVIL